MALRSARLPSKRNVMQQFPETLVLQLKRWQCDYDTSTQALTVKTISHQVTVDETLHTGVERHALRAVVRHSGAYNRGGGAGHL